MLRARRSASRLVSSSIWRTSRAASWRDLVLDLLEQDLLGLARRSGRPRARARAGALLALVEQLALAVELARRSSSARRAVDLGQLGVERFLACEQRSSMRPISPRRSRSSASTSVRRRWRRCRRCCSAMGAGCGLPVLVDPLATGRADDLLARRSGRRRQDPQPKRPPRSRSPCPFLSSPTGQARPSRCRVMKRRTGPCAGCAVSERCGARTRAASAGGGCGGVREAFGR